MLNSIVRGLDSCQTVHYFDFMKAFDNVPREKLLLKLRRIGISGHLWKWFKGGLYLKPTKFEHIFVAVITFFLFFCANTFDTILLLIVCALK